MKFGVLVCSKCHHALGVNLQFKTTTCPFCTKKLKYNQNQIKYQSNSELELSNLIKKINETLQLRKSQNQVDSRGDTDFGSVILGSDVGQSQIKPEDLEHRKKNGTVYEALDPFKRIAIKFDSKSINKSKNKPNSKYRSVSLSVVQTLVIELGHELGEFTDEDFRKLLQTLSLNDDKTDEYLEKLKELNVIYEPRQGIYCLIEN